MTEISDGKRLRHPSWRRGQYVTVLKTFEQDFECITEEGIRLRLPKTIKLMPYQECQTEGEA